MAKKGDNIQLFGDKALQKALLELSRKSASRVMTPAISQALTPIRRQAKENAAPHKRSGELVRASSKRTGRSRRNDRAYGKIYVKHRFGQYNGRANNPAKYAHFLEFGVPSRGIPARPFMRPAMAQKKQEAKRILVKVGWQKMEQFAGRLKRKYNTTKAVHVGRRFGRRF
jgi:HK97 gp10 family phage protein